ncbi:MAG: glycosyltransferase family 2 protein [Chloroflexi bacterium]|nr:glycosyltransferase family 2 protein [Chloroflexota bacterium]
MTEPSTLDPAEKKVTVSVFVPARNEAENVGPLIDKIARCFDQRHIDGEVVFVNDGSTDGTREEAETCAARYGFVRVFHHRKSLGLTAAMKTGFRHARGDIVIFLPADLESDPEEDIPKLMSEMDKGYDVVAGWRQGRHDNKVVASGIYNFVSRLLFNVPAHDMNWIKAFRREVIEELPLRSDWHRFVLMIAAAKGYKIGEVKTNYYPRKQGKSKFGFSRIPISFLDVLVVKFLLTFSQKPMLFFGSLGMGMILVAGLITSYLIYLWLSAHTQQRPILLFAGFLVVAGLLLFLVGFLAELIVSQFERLEELESLLKKGRE